MELSEETMAGASGGIERIDAFFEEWKQPDNEGTADKMLKDFLMLWITT